MDERSCQNCKNWRADQKVCRIFAPSVSKKGYCGEWVCGPDWVSDELTVPAAFAMDQGDGQIEG